MYWIILILGFLLLLAAFSRNRPDVPPLRIKERVVLFVFGLLLFFAGLGGILPEPSTEANGTSPPAEAVSQPTAPQPAATDTSSEAEDTPPPAPTLPGLKWVDITLNLERYPFGFQFKLEMVSPITYEQQRCAEKLDPDTGASMRVCVRSFGDDVTFVEAMVDGPGAKSTASWLIPYIATVPYEGSKPADAKAWAKEALQRVRSGKPVSKRIDGVVFTVLGNPPTSYSLRIHPADRERWVLVMTERAEEH